MTGEVKDRGLGLILCNQVAMDFVIEILSLSSKFFDVMILFWWGVVADGGLEGERRRRMEMGEDADWFFFC